MVIRHRDVEPLRPQLRVMLSVHQRRPPFNEPGEARLGDLRRGPGRQLLDVGQRCPPVRLRPSSRGQQPDMAEPDLPAQHGVGHLREGPEIPAGMHPRPRGRRVLDRPRGDPRRPGSGTVDRPLRAGLELVGPDSPERAQPLDDLTQPEQGRRPTSPGGGFAPGEPPAPIRQPLNLALERLHLAQHWTRLLLTHGVAGAPGARRDDDIGTGLIRNGTRRPHLTTWPTGCPHPRRPEPTPGTMGRTTHAMRPSRTPVRIIPRLRSARQARTSAVDAPAQPRARASRRSASRSAASAGPPHQEQGANRVDDPRRGLDLGPAPERRPGLEPLHLGPRDPPGAEHRDLEVLVGQYQQLPQPDDPEQRR